MYSTFGSLVVCTFEKCIAVLKPITFSLACFRRLVIWQGEECQRACRKDLPKSEWKSFTESGGGACPGFCGAAGACCRVGFGLESEACEYAFTTIS